MPFNSSGVRKLVPCDIDAIPEVDDKGRLNIDGWSITWEGEVQPGQYHCRVWDEWRNRRHGCAVRTGDGDRQLTRPELGKLIGTGQA